MFNKEIIAGLGGVMGGAFAYFFGPCDALLSGMLVLMVVDVVLGLLDAAAGVSSKTEGGKLSSRVMIKGVAKKCSELLMVCVGQILDMMTGMSVVRAGVVASISVAQVISILENASLLGVIDIPILKDALEVLNRKGDGNGKERH